MRYPLITVKTAVSPAAAGRERETEFRVQSSKFKEKVSSSAVVNRNGCPWARLGLENRLETEICELFVLNFEL
jgi:hypothetical protein